MKPATDTNRDEKLANQPKHTKGEWELKLSSTHIPMKGVLKVKGSNYDTIANLEFHQQDNKDSERNFEIINANAQRIVKAVNMHDELVETISEAKKLFNEFSTHIPVAYSPLKEKWAHFQDKLTKQLLKQAEQK